MMRQLEVGDKVLVLAGDGQLIFEDIYAFGHKLAGKKGVAMVAEGTGGWLL